MNLKLKLTLMVLLLLNIAVFAQDGYTLNGKVSDAENIPLIGASVQVEGTGSGVITDVDGSYQIEVKNGDVLKISYLGYICSLHAILRAAHGDACAKRIVEMEKHAAGTNGSKRESPILSRFSAFSISPPQRKWIL